MRSFVSHHGLWPVDKGSGKELQGSFSKRKRIPIVNHTDILFNGKEALQHFLGLGRTDESGLRSNPFDCPNKARMIGFHVIDNHIIYFRDIRDFIDLGQVFISFE